MSPRRVRARAQRAVTIWAELVAACEHSWPPSPVEMAAVVLDTADELDVDLPADDRDVLETVTALYREDMTAREAAILEARVADMLERIRSLRTALA